MVSLMEIMQLCRLCLVKEQVNVPIFEEQDDIRQICLKITSCLPVKITKEDRLPKKICDGCLYKLELLYQFYNTTVNAEKQLLTWLEQINMDASDKNFENLETQSTQPQATVKQEKLEPVESTNENPDMSTDAQNFMLQPESYQPEFTFKESQGSTTDAVDAAENSDEPLAKRPRRGRPRQATKPIPPESLDSSDNDNDNDNDNDAGDSMLEMTVTKTEEESESEGDENVDDPEPTKFEAVGEDTEQPGPSGLGKGGADGPDADPRQWSTPLRKRLREQRQVKKRKQLKKNKQLRKEDVRESSEEEKLKWLCKKCNQLYPTRKSLRNHRKVVHLEPHREQMYNYIYNKDKNTYSCKVCSMEFQKRHKMSEHFLTHEEKFTCEICSEVQYSAFRYSLHLFEHGNDDKYTCPICKYVTNRKHSIAKHINTIHLRKYLYYCKHCGKGFHDVVTYTEHERLHVGTNTVTCVVCQKEFSYTRNLTLHQKRYHRVSTVDVKLENQCAICKKSYSKSSTLKNHMRSHEKNTSKARPHLCEWCGKHFNDKGTLNHHNRIHTGYKPYKCSYCDKAFSRKGYLVLHERTHSGEKPYCCDHCGKRFNQPTSLRVHVRSHTGERPYSCHLCNHGFTSRSTLKNHVISCTGL